MSWGYSDKGRKNYNRDGIIIFMIIVAIYTLILIKAFTI